jgi:hypothetical protein
MEPGAEVACVSNSTSATNTYKEVHVQIEGFGAA